MRIRGFLLVEAIIFVFIMILSFIVMSKVMMNYSNINNQHILNMHEYMFINSCSPGHANQFQDYCKNNNIKIIKQSKFQGDVEIMGKIYRVFMKDSHDGYGFILL